MAESLDSKELLDREMALKYVQGDEEFLKEIYLIFFEEIPGRIESFKESIKNRNVSRLASLAHSLKGSSSTIGALLCSSLSEKLEIAAKNGNFEESVLIYSELENTLLNTRKMLYETEFS